MSYTIHTMTTKGEVEMRWVSAGDLNPFSEEFYKAAQDRVSASLGSNWSVARVTDGGWLNIRVERN